LADTVCVQDLNCIVLSISKLLRNNQNLESGTHNIQRNSRYSLVILIKKSRLVFRASVC